jgi:hypothetical protein
MKIASKIFASVFCMLIFTSGFTIGLPTEKELSYKQTLSGETCEEYFSYSYSMANYYNNFESTLILDTLDQQQTVNSGISWSISENGYYAQSFIPTISQLTKVQLLMFKRGAPDGLRISIRSSLTGPDLTLKYLSASSISANVSWIEFNFPDISVTPGTTYYIVWDPVGVPDFDNNFNWLVGTGNPYANGEAWKYLGSSWEIHNPTQSPDPDFCFKTYGTSSGGNNPPNKPTTPSGPTTGLINENLHYESYISDPDGDGMEVYFDWGDGTHTGWVGILTNGTVGNYNMWSSAGTYQVRVKTRDTPHLEESPWSNALSVTISDGTNEPPNKPSTPSGPTSGKTGISYTYSSVSIDPESDQIHYFFDWDDGTDSGWVGPYNSGDIFQESHIWTSQGDYSVKVKVKDSNDAESVWSDPLPISMPRTYAQDILFQILIKIRGCFS